jgi:CRISPR-associated protein Cas8a1/Csx13
MATHRTLTDDQEAAFIAAMHRAIFMGRGRIYADTMGQEAVRRKEPANSATENRWDKFMERLRLGLVGAKTANQMQSVVNELLARNGTVKELRDLEAVHLVRRFIFGDDWQRVKNLALFALACYQRPPKDEPIPGDPESD